LTRMPSSNNFPHMGRKKGYKAPQGLIKQRKSANWYIKAGVAGKLVYKSTRTSDLRKAELILAKVKVELLSLESQVHEVIGKSIPFRELIERYLSEVSSLKRSQRTDMTNARPLQAYFGDQKVDLITTQDVYKYQDWRKSQETQRTKQPISGMTINREVALLRSAFKKAIRWGYLDQNPAKGIEGFPEVKRERYISDEEFEAIMKAARSHEKSRHLADIVDTLYHTAQRSGRILGFKWNQINLKERTITFEQLSKTKKVPHIIWINDPLFALLSKLKLKRGASKVICSWVFHKDDGSPYTSIKTAWNTACRKANLRDVRIHDIRHKAITDMVRAGFSLEFVGRVAGHKTTATTHRYAHLSVESTKAPLESLGKLR